MTEQHNKKSPQEERKSGECNVGSDSAQNS